MVARYFLAGFSIKNSSRLRPWASASTIHLGGRPRPLQVTPVSGFLERGGSLLVPPALARSIWRLYRRSISAGVISYSIMERTMVFMTGRLWRVFKIGRESG